ncbi:uncharacterized protein LOC120566512 [Perca fluviatilis]|uniref:uncharacterized protein LOC120566512 n=1 Tax=Perca fluviatilis TaxID=8168 RepID=UPI001965023D|nr:uncharacterized protein LOC120566512 [Perca fluviatilis]
MSDFESDLASDPGPDPFSSPAAIPASSDGVRRSSRLATLQSPCPGGAASDGLILQLRNRGIVAASGLPSPDLRELAAQAGSISPVPSPPAPAAVRGRKRSAKAIALPRAPPKKRGAAPLSQAAVAGVPSGSFDTSLILASLQSLAGSLQSMDARLQSIEASPAFIRSTTATTAVASLSLPAHGFPLPEFSLATSAPAPFLGRPYIPAAANISAHLRAKILQGKDVNLVSLILPSPECERDVVSGDGFSAVFKSADPRLCKELSIGQFLVAFGLFREVICSVYPDRRAELDSYLALIGDLNLKYGRNIFFHYHKAFSSKAALHLARSNVRVDWSVVDLELLVMLVGGAQVIACSACGAQGHMAALCPVAAFRLGPGAASLPPLRGSPPGGPSRRRQVPQNYNPPLPLNEGGSSLVQRVV